MLFNTALVLALVAANGFFVAAEFALVKVRLGEIQALAKEGSRTVRLAAHIVERLDAYLSACQLGITLASLGLGWVGEPLVAGSLGPLFSALGLPDTWAHTAAFPVAFLLITFLHITIGEQVPKMLAIHRYYPTSLAVAWPLMVFYKSLKPFIWGLNVSSNAMLRLVGIDLAGGHGENPTEDQIRLMLVDSAAGGHLTPREHVMMENILDLEERPARRAMLPRNRIDFLDRNDPIEEKLRKLSGSGHSRMPLCDKDLDHILGIIHAKDVLQAMTAPEPLEALVGLARPPLYVPENIKLDMLLRQFQREKMPLALLIDEYGSVSGMITLEDVLEEVVGPLQDEFDAETPLIVKKGDGFELDALCPLHEAAARCCFSLPQSKADTIGGLILEELGRMPQQGEDIDLPPYTLTVLEVEPTRIRRVSLMRKGEDKADEPKTAI